MKAAALAVLGQLFPAGRVVRLQRALDFVNAAHLVVDTCNGTRKQKVAQAVDLAARLLFTLPADVARNLKEHVAHEHREHAIGGGECTG